MRWRRWAILLASLVLPILLCILAAFSISGRVAQQERQNEEFKQAISKLDVQIEKINSLEADDAKFSARFAESDYLRRRTVAQGYLLASMSRVQTGIEITRIECENETVVVRGRAAGTAEAADAAEVLSETKGIANVRIVTASTNAAGFVDFTLNAGLARP